MEELNAHQIARIERIKEKKAQEKKLAGTMALLKKNTHQRDIAEIKLDCERRKRMNTNEKHIFALGRLAKYEDGIVEEALDFAKEAGMFISCNSKIVNEKSHIDDYETKNGKKIKVHYTVYNHYLGKCDKLGNEPIYYDGNFLYKEYENTFNKYQRAYVESFIKIEDLFDFEQTVGDYDDDE